MKKYDKYVGLEDNFQISIAYYLNSLGLFWCHVANERKTSILAGAKLKRKGVLAGVSDCIIFEPRGEFHGLFIELKTKGGSLQPSQKNFINNANERNYKAVVCWCVDEVVDVVENYLKL